MDPETTNANVGIAAGRVYLMRARLAVDGAINKVGIGLRTTAPAGCTGSFVGVYTQQGVTATRVALSADVSATVNGVSTPTYYALSAPTPALKAGDKVLLAFL